MPAPDKIQRLVEVFERNLSAYKSPGYKEAQLRTEFIEPFFEELGWDVRNRQGWAEAYKDVITEDAIKVGGYTKAPDYCFRIGGTRKFFLEAKKPSVDIKGDVSPAYQLRRYAWSADLPLSILTDFEEFAVYNCRVRPQLKDKPGQDRVMFIPYREYAERWDEIAAVFSRKAVLEGLFDKYAESVVGRRTTQEVDDEFLKEIEGWRDLLARNIALRNPSLSIRELNYAVQKTIDRIIFLRICEDRGAERYGQLQALLNGPRIYRRLTEIFQQADEKYNSGLFHFREEKGMVSPPDTLTTALTIDDQVLKEILKNLYYPDSPYEFSVLGSEILGNIYEQFLGKVIRLTAGHHAVVEEKPEVRKAGGVYYTPTYIVDYIVKNTVGKLCEEKTPKQIEKLKILDPACGSGSFLIGAYTYLLNYHRDWYVKHLLPQRGFEGVIAKAALKKLVPGEKPEMPIYQGRGGQWYLSTREKKRILLNNIHGVDIDSQAVEVTKLSLLLKVLENENQDTLDRQMKLWRERALPDLGNNIKCGNSLIGPDIYEAGSLRAKRSNLISFTPEDRERINAFDWNAEFPEIFTTKDTKGTKDNAGFDVVIGNPPYIRIQTLQETSPEQVAFFKQHYRAAGSGNYDIYVVFVEKGLSLLNKQGRLGFILPHKFFNSKYGEPLRGLIAAGKNLAHVVHFGDQQVFDGATTYTALMFLDRSGSDSFELVRVKDLGAWRLGESQPCGEVKAKAVTSVEWNFAVGASAKLFEKLNAMPLKLGAMADIFVGLQTSADAVFIMDFMGETPRGIKLKSKALNREWTFENGLLFPLISGTDVCRYNPLPERQYILFPYNVDNETAVLLDFDYIVKSYPKTADYLVKNKVILEERERGKFKGPEWYRFGRNQNIGIQRRIKLCVPRLVDELCASYDKEGSHFLDNVDVGGVTMKAGFREYDLAFFVGLINSKLLRWYFPFISAPFRGGWRSANKQYLVQLPIRPIDFSNPGDMTAHSRMISLVERMLDLHKRLAAAKNPDEKVRLDREIKATDDQIDRLVYELYGLTEKEIGIVERAET